MDSFRPLLHLTQTSQTNFSGFVEQLFALPNAFINYGSVATNNSTISINWLPDRNFSDIDTSCYIQLPLIAQTFTYVGYRILLPVLMLIGILGNMFVMYVFACRQKLESSGSLTVCMLSLMGADSAFLLLAFVLLGLPTIFPQMLYMVPIIFGLGHWARAMSVLLSTVIVIDRWLAVTLPLIHKVNMTGNKMIRICGLITIISALYSLPRFWEVDIAVATYCDGTSKLEAFASDFRMNAKYKEGYLFGVNFVLLYLIPCGTVSVLNVIILKRLRAVRAYREESAGLVRSSGSLSSTCSPALRRGYSTTAMLCLEAFVFLCCCTLSLILNAIEALNVDWYNDMLAASTILQLTNNLLAVFNSVTNFFVFYIFGTQFRQEVQASFKDMTSMRRSFANGRMSYSAIDLNSNHKLTALATTVSTAGICAAASCIELNNRMPIEAQRRQHLALLAVKASNVPSFDDAST